MGEHIPMLLLALFLLGIVLIIIAIVWACWDRK